MPESLLAPDFTKPETPANQNQELRHDDEANASSARDHWEQEKEKLALVLTERLLRGREAIPFSELNQTALFRNQALDKVGEIALALLRQQARRIIRQEKPLVLQSKRRFELDDAEMHEQLRRLRNSLAARLFFARNELHAAVTFAVRLQFDLLTKPPAALEQLIYPCSPVRQKADIAVILAGLNEDHPFIAAIQSLLGEYPDGPMTKEKFLEVCRGAEKEIYGAHPVAAVMTDLRAYQKFCASIDLSNTARISSPAVLRLLRERGLYELAEKALPEFTQQQWLSIPEIELLLEHCLVRLSAPTQPPSPVISPPVTEFELSRVLQETAAHMKSLADTREKEQGAPAPPIDGTQFFLNLESEHKFENHSEIEFQEVDVKAILEVEEAVIPKPPKIVYRDDEIEAPLIVERAKLEVQPPGPYPAMTRLIDEKSRSAFIKKIFRKDIEAYLAFIDELEMTQTWKEAKKFLDREFQARKINPYSKEAVHLSDLVFSRYFTKGAK
jgi:hypothetical protein